MKLEFACIALRRRILLVVAARKWKRSLKVAARTSKCKRKRTKLRDWLFCVVTQIELSKVQKSFFLSFRVTLAPYFSMSRTTHNEFICSLEKDNGLKTCDQIPPYRVTNILRCFYNFSQIYTSKIKTWTCYIVALPVYV